MNELDIKALKRLKEDTEKFTLPIRLAHAEFAAIIAALEDHERLRAIARGILADFDRGGDIIDEGRAQDLRAALEGRNG